MKVLLIGSGGREHAMALSIKKSNLCTELLCAPGNPGMATAWTMLPRWCRKPKRNRRTCKKGRCGLYNYRSRGPACCRCGRRISKTRDENFWTHGGSGSIRRQQGIQQEVYETARYSNSRLRNVYGLAKSKRLSGKSSRSDSCKSLRACSRKRCCCLPNKGRGSEHAWRYAWRKSGIWHGGKNRCDRRIYGRRRSIYFCSMRWKRLSAAGTGTGP